MMETNCIVVLERQKTTIPKIYIVASFTKKWITMFEFELAIVELMLAQYNLLHSFPFLVVLQNAGTLT